MCNVDAIRKRARSIAKHVGITLFIKAQRGFCPICNKKIADNDDTSVDHVYPIRGSDAFDDRDPNPGNLLVAHKRCNELKGNRAPTKGEIATLAMVNDLLGFNEQTGIYIVSEWAKSTVNTRLRSLKHRRDRFDFDSCDNKGAVENMQLNFGMICMEIESLEIMLKMYDEVFEIDD